MGIDVEGDDFARVVEQERQDVAAARGDGQNDVRGLNLKGRAVELGILPAVGVEHVLEDFFLDGRLRLSLAMPIFVWTMAQSTTAGRPTTTAQTSFPVMAARTKPGMKKR